MVSTKELNELTNSFKQKSEEYVQDQAEFIDVVPLNGDSRFNMETNTGKQCKTQSEWLTEAFSTRWPAEKELEMFEIT